MCLELVANQDKSPFLIERPFIEVLDALLGLAPFPHRRS